MKNSNVLFWAFAARTALADCGTIISWVTVTVEPTPSVPTTFISAVSPTSTSTSLLPESSSVAPSSQSSTPGFVFITAEPTSAASTTATSLTELATTAISSTDLTTTTTKPNKAKITTTDATTAASIETTSTDATTPATSVQATTDAKTTPATTTTPTSTETVAAPAAATSATETSTSSSLGSSVSGEATFYGGNLAGGDCSFSTYTLPSGLFGTAFSGSAWESAGHCGECVKVTGPNGNSITAMVVDKCPECDSTHLDLFQDAFAEIGAISAGIIDITYEFVECGITTPISLVNKDGTSQYFFAMQVVNANVPVSTLEISTDGGSTWVATERQDYNFFQISSGSGSSTVTVKITSTTGQTITVDNVSVASGTQVSAGSNFS